MVEKYIKDLFLAQANTLLIGHFFHILITYTKAYKQTFRHKRTEIPTLLVQGIDARLILPDPVKCRKTPSLCRIGIAPKQEDIPEISVSQQKIRTLHFPISYLFLIK